MKYKKDEELKSANERAVLRTAGGQKPDLNAERAVMTTPAGQKPDFNAQNLIMTTPAGQNNNQGASDKQFGAYQPAKTGQQMSAENNSLKPTVNAESQAWNDAMQQKMKPGTANGYYDNADSMEKPEFESQYDSQISGLVDKILNGEKFDYDVNSDALFANYADVYERNAKKAAEDAMGRGAAASGGYGNSYASAAASQAYNSQMQNLNAAVPQLQELAYQQYLAQKQDEYNQLNMMKGLDDSDYSRHRDSMSDFYADRDYNVAMGDRVQSQENWQAEYDASREDSAWEKQFAENQFEYGKEQDAQAQQNWQAEYDASREDSAWEKQFAENQFEYGKQQDAQNQANIDREFEFNKNVWENESNMNEALAAADYGNFDLLEWYTGADFSDAKEWEKIKKGAEMYSATGLVSFLKDAGIDTTYLEDNIADEDYSNQLAIGLSVYEATGSPAMLQKLGIDTSYMDKILSYTLKEAENSANGSSGGSGGRSYSGSGSVVTSGSNDSYSEPAVWGDKTAADIAAEVAYHYQGQGVAWNSRTVSDYIVENYPGLSIEAKHAINAYMADPDSGLEELMYTGMAPRK